jgi:hypothetical protein
MEILVTKSHLDVALEATAANDQDSVEETCLIAQAIRSVIPRKKISVGDETVEIGKGRNEVSYDRDAIGDNLVTRFDELIDDLRGYDDVHCLPPVLARKVAKLRASLPQTVTLTEN